MLSNKGDKEIKINFKENKNKKTLSSMEGNRNKEKLSFKLNGREGGKMALPEGHFSRCFRSA